MREPEQAPNAEPIAIAGQFADFDQFVEFSTAWDVDFRQIGPGNLNAKLSQAVGKSWSLVMANFDRPAFQQGTSITGLRTFAFLDPHATEQEWCGQRFSPDAIVVFPGDGAFQAISQPGFNVFTLSFAEEQLASACERLGIPDVTEKFLTSGAMLQIDRTRTGGLRRQVISTLQALCGKGLQGSGWTGGDHIRDKISESLVLLLTDSSYLVRTPSQLVRSMAIRRAFDVIEAGLEKAISVGEVVAASGISRRTLEYAFRNRYGFSPKEFINSQRMVKVRRDLLSESGTITAIANRWGYWHMGQFSRDYWLQFGELPSQTQN